MEKKIFFGSNLKMYKNDKETLSYLKRLIENTRDLDRNEIHLFIIPSYISLNRIYDKIDKEFIQIGAQNMCWEDQGQFTGEISPVMLEEFDIDLVMIGHSERRHVFGESDIEENKKVLSALEHQMTALLCIGETKDQKELGISAEALREQLKIGLHNVDASYATRIWVAYEPVWSIGVNGTPATPEYAEEMHQVIHKTLVEIFGEKGKIIPVLYGGSVNHVNANLLVIQPHIDGLFVGRAAWDADAFNKLIRDSLSSLKAIGRRN